MIDHPGKTVSIETGGALGRPLAPWTYLNPEVFELEYEELFLNRWQFVGHESEVTETGDYITGDVGRDSVVVVRGKDMQLRAFRNVCRHRASRIFAGSGTCRGVIRCPYHGWTYRLDGSLMAIPQEENFPGTDRSHFSLHQIQLDIFNGLIFVRFAVAGPTIADQFAHTAHFFKNFDVANYEKLQESSDQVWNVNWKVAWDNFLENYHIPIGHPGLNRLLTENGEWDELSSGVSFGVFELRDKPSKVKEERLYQQQLHFADQRIPDAVKGKWVQFGLTPNLGIDLYPEMLDMFQLIPIGPDKTIVRTSFYGHKNPTPEETELRRLNLLINDPVNEEDRTICQRVQQGLQTHDYQPGPLSLQESCIFNFHEMLRELIPVMSLQRPPARGSVDTVNAEMKASLNGG